MTGLFFCLASANGAGLLFCPAEIQPHTSVYSEFCAVHATIPPTQQNSARGFTEAFPAICRIFSLLCAGVSSYTAPPATRWSISQRRSTSSEYQIPAPRRTLYRTAQPPYYNKVYKGAAVCLCYRSMPDGATHRRPCQPGGVSMLPTPGISMAPGWPGISMALCFLPGTAARNHWRLPPYLFSGFRPIANKGEQ